MTPEYFKMLENMERYGGSFVQALANCFFRADPENFKRLLEAFPEYVEKYKNWGGESK